MPLGAFSKPASHSQMTEPSARVDATKPLWQRQSAMLVAESLSVEECSGHGRQAVANVWPDSLFQVPVHGP